VAVAGGSLAASAATALRRRSGVLAGDQFVAPRGRPRAAVYHQSVFDIGGDLQEGLLDVHVLLRGGLEEVYVVLLSQGLALLIRNRLKRPQNSIAFR
jgi:hypothetical protein